jgi:hypothetical protein
MMDALSIDGKLTDCCNVEYLDILSCDMDHWTGNLERISFEIVYDCKYSADSILIYMLINTLCCHLTAQSFTPVVSGIYSFVINNAYRVTYEVEFESVTQLEAHWQYSKQS